MIMFNGLIETRMWGSIHAMLCFTLIFNIIPHKTKHHKTSP